MTKYADEKFFLEEEFLFLAEAFVE